MGWEQLWDVEEDPHITQLGWWRNDSIKQKHGIVDILVHTF